MALNKVEKRRLHDCRLLVFTLAVLFGTACVPGAPPVTYSVMPSALTPVDGDRNKAKDFARVFCSTLPHLKDKDGRKWAECAKYLETSEASQAQAAFATSYRFLIVAGLGGDCLKDVRAFSTSIAHLKAEHQVDVEYFAVAPFGSSSENGTSIAKHINEGWAADQKRRYVLVGYSKGAADLLEAMRLLDAPKTRVAAVVTIAGIVGGLWSTDDLQPLMQPSRPWMAPSCPGNVQDGVLTLTRELRQRFLRDNALPVPGYSIVAASSLDDTSAVLRQTWRRLSVHAREQDGIAVAWEAMLPGGKYLGTARADHWAIALPFEESAHPPKAIDRNHFPRDALLEAIVRFVSADLGS